MLVLSEATLSRTLKRKNPHKTTATASMIWLHNHQTSTPEVSVAHVELWPRTHAKSVAKKVPVLHTACMYTQQVKNNGAKAVNMLPARVRHQTFELKHNTPQSGM